MKTSIRIGKVMGLPIKIHISFLLVLVLFPAVFANDAVFGFADVASVLLRYALALTLTILLFSCVLLHELGHPVVDQFTEKIVGIVTFTDIRGVPMSEHGNVLVQDRGSITGIVSGTNLTRSIEVLGYRER